ncbi:MAG: hypothetical protein AAFU64_18745, partial [Bacteroidota bacterium]
GYIIFLQEMPHPRKKAIRPGKLLIPYEYLMTASKEITSIQNIVGKDDLIYAIRPKEAPSILLTPINQFYNLYDAPPEIRGTEAYAFDPIARKISLTKVKIPPLLPNQNKVNMTIKVANDPEDLSKLTSSFRIQAGGSIKERYFRYINPYDVIYQSAAQYDSPLRKDDPKVAKSEMKLAEIKQREEDDNKARLKLLQEEYLDDFQLEKSELEIQNFKLVETGIYHDSPDIIYELDLIINGLVKKVGKNYLINIGKLIGGQIKVDEQDRRRKHDIYMPYARTYEHNIAYTIPDGYQVEGIENFNKQVENATGKFVSKAKLNGDVLEVKIVKQYNHSSEKASEWPKMLEFLDAANELYTQSVLIRKK